MTIRVWSIINLLAVVSIHVHDQFQRVLPCSLSMFSIDDSLVRRISIASTLQNKSDIERYTSPRCRYRCWQLNGMRATPANDKMPAASAAAAAAVSRQAVLHRWANNKAINAPRTTCTDDRTKPREPIRAGRDRPRAKD